MSEQALLPCPFCGSDGEEVSLYHLAPPRAEHAWFVRCHVCHVETLHAESDTEAIAAWNRRSHQAAIAANSEPVAIFNVRAGTPVITWLDAPPASETKLYTHPQPREGWVMVPKEPTEEMLAAGKDVRIETEDDERGFGMSTENNELRAGLIWEAMISAAPIAGKEEGKNADQT